MKVLVVNASDSEGGAARAAYRLHCSLLSLKINSLMLVQNKTLDSSRVIGPETKFRKLMGKVRPQLDLLITRSYRNRTKTLFSPAWVPFSTVADQINHEAPDVVHLHWVAGGMLRIEDIAKIKAPIVWSLHDMWPFTGGCHYDENCGAYKDSCGNCKVLVSQKRNDLSKRVFLRKKQAYSRQPHLTVVGLSSWLADEARSSSLFSGHRVVNLPNPIDTNVFAPFDRSMARSLLGLPAEKRLILFGAMGATSDPRKGFSQLSRALEGLDMPDAELVVFGASQPPEGTSFAQTAHYLGRLYDDVTLRLLYSAADVMLVPSLQENLSNAIMESLACGTPVVGFDIGGNRDLVDHKANGFLASPFDTVDLANGIKWVLDHANYETLSEQARTKVTQNFNYDIVAPKYVELYRSILGKAVS